MRTGLFYLGYDDKQHFHSQTSLTFVSLTEGITHRNPRQGCFAPRTAASSLTRIPVRDTG